MWVSNYVLVENNDFGNCNFVIGLVCLLCKEVMKKRSDNSYC